MTTKHTPGPWTVHNQINLAMAQVVGKDGHSVAMLCANGENAERGFDNLALITAAPEMFEALRTIVEYGPQSGMKADAPMLIAARAAIAKATGQ